MTSYFWDDSSKTWKLQRNLCLFIVWILLHTFQPVVFLCRWRFLNTEDIKKIFFGFCLEIKKAVLPEKQTIGKNGWKQKNILIFSNFFLFYNKDLIIKAKILLIKSNKNHHYHCFMIVFIISFILLLMQTLFLIIFITEVLNHEGVAPQGFRREYFNFLIFLFTELCLLNDSILAFY